jgi:hypothetical protein
MDAVAGGGLGEAGDWDRGDTLGGVCVVIGGDMCVCVFFCVCSCIPIWYVRMLFVRTGMAFLVAGKSFGMLPCTLGILFGPAALTHTHT